MNSITSVPNFCGEAFRSAYGGGGVMVTVLTVLAAIVVAWVLAYHRLPAVAWAAAFAALLFGYGIAGWWSAG